MMKLLQRASRTCIFLMGAAIAACGGQQASMPTSALSARNTALVGQLRYGSSAPLHRKTMPLLYISLLSAYAQAVYFYSQKGLSLQGQITQGVVQPEGLAVDRKGNLYVTNSANNNVTVYPPGGSSASVTYTDDLSTPVDVAVNEKGWVYVANLASPQGVVSYPPGSTTASKTFVQLPGFSPQGLALDSSGKLYVSYTGSGSSQVYKYPPHKAKGVSLGLTIGTPIGITLDGSNNLLIADRNSPYSSGKPAIEVFPKGQQQPSQVIAYSGFNTPAMLEFNRKRNRLYVADCNRSGKGNLFVFAYPSGSFVSAVSLPEYSCPVGVGLAPPAP